MQEPVFTYDPGAVGVVSRYQIDNVSRGLPGDTGTDE